MIGVRRKFRQNVHQETAIAPASSAAEPHLIPRMSRVLRLTAALMLIIMVGAIFQRLLLQRSTILDGARNDLARLDMLFVEQTGRAIEAVDIILRDIAKQQDRTAAGRGAESESLANRLARRIDGVSQVAQIVVADGDGTPRAAAPPGPPADATQTAALQDMLGTLRAGPAPGLRIGAPYRRPDGVWTVMIGRRIDAPGGDLAGFVAASLNLAFFEEFYRSVELADDGIITLHRRDGTILASAPHLDTAIGGSAAAEPAFQTLLGTDGVGAGLVTRPSDGSARIEAVRAHKTLPLVISVSISRDLALTAWRQRGMLLLAGGLALSGLVWMLMAYIARQTRHVEDLLAENSRARAEAEAANASLTAQIEERERTEAALQQAQRLEAIGQLTGGVAHDFNNLLTVLLGNIDLMQARIPGDRRSPDPTIVARLERMRAAAEKGATLTDQLLAFARRQPLHPKPAQLNMVITAMTDLLQSAIGSNIRLAESFAQDGWPVLVDTTQIELVLLNLALNARDAMPKGGTLTLRTDNVAITDEDASPDLPAGDYVAVRVIDTGVGMTDEVRAKAFEPFFTTKGPGMGSGLGLSQVYGVARQSGGSVRIESQVGKGTTVTVYLPRVDVALTDGPACGEAATTITQGARVMLVDDDLDVRATTALILEAIGYTLIEAASGVDALRMIDEGTTFDLLLTDVVMPEMNGADLASEVRSRHPATPIIFISGYADPAALAGRQTLHPLIRKPFRATELAQAIEQSLADARQIATLRAAS